ncbi:ATP-binding protein [Haloarcula onubensis]|uniref:histidine kinase n=1 Tax=Haloarcula onubensis TaxID=2950539 RepID=A0ABU2FPC2_9EURY|nr:ATP-binding protein [Halomicroarcula sp. S3CR25-11]MDS0282618.1 ATP-binding protein [Halomicroarcula sp. S3CR25-11]
MERRQLSGGLIALLGSGLAVFLLVDAAITSESVYWTVQAYPIALSLMLAGTGVLLAHGRLIEARYLPRLLAWMAGGVVSLSVLAAYLYGLAIVFAGNELLSRPVGGITITTFGALVGAIVGVYDARAAERKRALEAVGQLNETLRIATGELVEQHDRRALERAVCGRLTESTAYETAWVGRYHAAETHVRVVASAGPGGAALDGLELPVGPETASTAAVETGTVQVVTDVRADDVIGTAREALEAGGVESLAVVPIVGTDDVHGLLGVGASDGDFDTQELAVLGELGETVGHAIDSIRAREGLQRREQELVAHNERLDKFASVVSHDLRNPLEVILGRVAYLREREESEHLAAVERSGRRMEAIIADLLALSRSGQSVDERAPVALTTAARDGWATVETDGATLDVDVPGTVTVEADRTRLLRLFENLFRNAIEHGSTDGRPLTVRVSVVETAPGGGIAGFAVEDDGVGIPPEARAEVFDHGYTTNADGTGFGLSIVEEIVGAHGWEISVATSELGGARFEIRTQ